MTVKHTVIRRRERFDFDGGLEPSEMTDLIAVVAVEEEEEAEEEETNGEFRCWSAGA